MINVAQGFGNNVTSVKYFNPGTMVASELLPDGVNIYILGPPRGSLINKSNPSHGEHKQTYFGLDNLAVDGFIDALFASDSHGDQSAGGDAYVPFSDNGINKQVAEEMLFFKKHYFSSQNRYRLIDDAWLDVVGQFALQLDGAVNNTSLVLAIELTESGKVMLFPGDAQVGSLSLIHI